MANLSHKQRIFVEAYLGEATGNATEAARIAGYKFPNVQGTQNLVNASIAALISARVADVAMGADEVLRRLGEHARGMIGQFVDESGRLTLVGEEAKANLHLVKRLKRKQTPSEFGTSMETEIEVYDAEGALIQLGRYHKLFTDKHEIDVGDKALDLLRQALGVKPDGGGTGA